jgi:hypothetical protein
MSKEDLEADGHNHVVKYIDSFTFRNHPCIVFELLGQNLFKAVSN